MKIPNNGDTQEDSTEKQTKRIMQLKKAWYNDPKSAEKYIDKVVVLSCTGAYIPGKWYCPVDKDKKPIIKNKIFVPEDAEKIPLGYIECNF